MATWKQPIIDRTQADVQYAQAHRDSLEPLKGARNISDLQRVRDNLQHLSDVLNGYGYVVSLLAMPISEVPTYSEIQTISNNIQRMRNVLSVFTSTPSTPKLPINVYWKMNDLEKILHDIDILIKNMIAEFTYSGETYSGEDDYV